MSTILISLNVILICIKSSGTLYTYLACGTGRTPMQGAFRALTRGFNHWASGRLHFVIYTKDVSVERIYFDNDYWLHTLLPKLEGFFDNCLGPEIVSPLHTLGIPMRNYTK